jgi:peroxiredoxin
MRRIIYFLIIALTFSCKSKTPNNGFTISGNINGNYSDYIYLNYDNKIDSTLIVNNSFEFKGKVKTPIQGNISLRAPSYVSFIYLENSNITLEYKVYKKLEKKEELNVLKLLEIKGSKTALLQADYKNFYQKNQSKPNFKNLLFNKLDSTFKKNSNHPFYGTVLGEIALLEPVFNYNEIAVLLKELDTTGFNSEIREMLNQGLSNLDKFGIGKPFPIIDLPNQKQEKFSINNFKGKITLVDFWASWCKPCRINHPKLISLYTDYKKSNFEIVSVSIDTDINNWNKAIKKDNLTWTNILDEEKKLYNTLGIFGIPASYLVDEKGAIIGKNLSPEKIKNYLNKKSIK